MSIQELCLSCKPQGKCIFKEARIQLLDSITPMAGGKFDEKIIEKAQGNFDIYLETAVNLGCKEAISVKLISLQRQVSPVEILKENQRQEGKTSAK